MFSRRVGRCLASGLGLRLRLSRLARELHCKAAVYEEHGNALRNIRVKELELPPLQAGQVRLRMLAAPINPSDINMIEGVYSITPPLPAVGGNEGVAVVEETAPDVTSLRVGSWVIPSRPGFGTWRTHAVCNSASVMEVPSDVPALDVATVSVNPCSAFRMLHDFVQLAPGDAIIQNGSNSAVGMAIIQLAKHMGVRTVNIVRDRPDLRSLTEVLKGYGADFVFTEEQLKGRTFADELKKAIGDKPLKLGLNCVGGLSSTELSRHLSAGGVLVTYGGMSKKPVTISTGALIFKDISLRGFWLSRWNEVHTVEERKEMIHHVLGLIRQGKFKIQVEPRPFGDFDAALARSLEGYRTNKVVLTF